MFDKLFKFLQGATTKLDYAVRLFLQHRVHRYLETNAHPRLLPRKKGLFFLFVFLFLRPSWFQSFGFALHRLFIFPLSCSRIQQSLAAERGCGEEAFLFSSNANNESKHHILLIGRRCPRWEDKVS